MTGVSEKPRQASAPGPDGPGDAALPPPPQAPGVVVPPLDPTRVLLPLSLVGLYVMEKVLMIFVVAAMITA